MCGILGFVSRRPVYATMMEALTNMSYRGYDSSGICIIDGEGLQLAKAVGAPAKLAEQLKGASPNGNTGIAHTRWATHGEPSHANAHPHLDCSGDVAVVHNGIIENYLAIKSKLIAAGHVFLSETDSEVIGHLIEAGLQSGLDLADAARAAAKELRGAFAFVALERHAEREVVGVRNDCPLLIAMGRDGIFLTSDAASVMDHATQLVVLDNGQVAQIRDDSFDVTDLDGNPSEFAITDIDWSREQAERGGYDHFMLKEIHEQPETAAQLIHERLSSSGETFFPELDKVVPKEIDQVVLMACGTASYAAAFGKVLIEDLTGIPVLAEVGSEFRYRRNFVSERTLFIALSQS